jgi:adenylate kinase
METRTIFFVGKPGCGKGTQAKLLAEATGWPVFASGEQFRALAKADTHAGHKAARELASGALMPHWFAMYLYLKSLFGVPEGASAIFDGFNRKVEEAQLVVDSMRWLERSFLVLHIAISDETMRERLAGRHATSGRADDAPEVFPERLKEYREHTEPAIELFRKEGTLVEIDGEPAPEAIAAAIKAALKI